MWINWCLKNLCFYWSVFLLQNNCFQPFTDCGGVWKLPDGALPTHWRSCQTHGGMLVQKKRRLMLFQKFWKKGDGWIYADCQGFMSENVRQRFFLMGWFVILMSLLNCDTLLCNDSGDIMLSRFNLCYMMMNIFNWKFLLSIFLDCLSLACFSLHVSLLWCLIS